MWKRENEYPSARDLAKPEEVEAAKQRGEELGFAGIFLDSFIENEIKLKKRVKQDQ